MKFTETTVGGSVEILASKDFQAIPVTVAEPQSGTVVKAGSPLDADGEVVDGSSTAAVGILLYDVDTDANPNGALVVKGIINAEVAQEHSGVTYDSGLAAMLPGVIFRENIGVNT